MKTGDARFETWWDERQLNMKSAPVLRVIEKRLAYAAWCAALGPYLQQHNPMLDALTEYDREADGCFVEPPPGPCRPEDTVVLPDRGTRCQRCGFVLSRPLPPPAKPEYDGDYVEPPPGGIDG